MGNQTSSPRDAAGTPSTSKPPRSSLDAVQSNEPRRSSRDSKEEAQPRRSRSRSASGTAPPSASTPLTLNETAKPDGVSGTLDNLPAASSSYPSASPSPPATAPLDIPSAIRVKTATSSRSEDERPYRNSARIVHGYGPKGMAPLVTSKGTERSEVIFIEIETKKECLFVRF